MFNSFSHHIKAADIQYKEVEEQLQSLSQQLSDSDAKSADLSEKLEKVTQSLSSSETKCAQLEAELEDKHSARLRVESELDMLSQQLTRHSVHDDSPPGSSARKAEAAQQELQDVRLAPYHVQA